MQNIYRPSPYFIGLLPLFMYISLLPDDDTDFFQLKHHLFDFNKKTTFFKKVVFYVIKRLLVS
ncbi:hypothetical protein [Paenibacillus odorifer]|uniref:hypothetical protein n=1 Tax=Paenibacillus odorifer TaxID=189426 RepID=UPI001C4CABCF|nr:hypothetical protein [Paenibacillus odorifer]